MNKQKLIRIAIRDRSLLNGYIWHKNKRLSYKTWLDYSIKNDVVIRPPNKKMSVWFDPNELYKINKLILKKITKDSSFVDRIEESARSVWKELQPFISKKKPISTITEFQFFFHSYILWWSHVSIFMIIPDIEEIPLVIKEKVLGIRSKYEKFSDVSDQLLLQYFKKYFPDYKDISNVISPDEIVSLSKNTLTIKELDAIKKRNKRGWVLINGELSSHNNIEKLLTKHRLKLTTDIAETNIDRLVGMSAYKGNIRGVVKLVFNKRDLYKVKKGDILVSDATTPDFLPAMNKATGFITDEGGITSHTAIVAREMKKPCIVGTKIATQVLKDGDLVEVDADKGIVKKI
jgi:phosphohistidine swiveling domain-containing protein